MVGNSLGRNNLSKIKSLPLLERPREKAFHYGVESLSDHELIAILIGSGTQNSSAIEIAFRMLQDNHGLYHLVQKPFSDLISTKGIGKVKAVKIIAAFEIAKRFNSLKGTPSEEPVSIDTIYQKYKNLTIYQNQESLYLIILNSYKKIVHEVNLYKGNENSVVCSWRQIVQQVLIHNGKYFYILHNHPSGDTSPSPQDIEFTSTLLRESKKLNIIMLDHLIISENGYFSFLESKLK